MNYESDCTLPKEYLERLAAAEPEGLLELIRAFVYEAMCMERENYMGDNFYERSEKSQDHTNGYKFKTVKTRVGEITFRVPQVQEGGFYLETLEKELRSERALALTMTEMYVRGVST